MAVKGVYSKAEERMIAEFEKKSAELTGWVGEMPSAEFAFPGHRVASKELIHHMATAADFKNPLYRDEQYARNTRWGGIIAPPFYYHAILHGGRICFLTMPPEDGIVRSERVLMIQQGDFYQPIRPGDSFKIWLGPTKIIDVTKSGENSLRQFKLVRVVSYINQRDEVVCSNTDTHFYTLYPPKKEAGAYMHFVMEKNEGEKGDDKPMSYTKELSYTKEEIETIDRLYAHEQRRGGEIRYWEDVQVGEELPSIVMGPLTAWDTVVAMQGFGAGSVTMNDLRTIGADTVLVDPRTNIPHQDIELHLLDNMAQLVSSYSTTLLGPPILHFFSRLVTNWAGDDGFVRRLTWTKLANTPMGDTIFGRGRVTRKYVENGEYLVDVDVWMESNRGFISNVGPATVSLFSREKIFSKNEPPKFKAAALTGPYEYDSGSHGQNVEAQLLAGDRIRIMDRPGWPMPGGYKLANRTGTIYQVVDSPEGYVLVQLDEDVTGIDTRVPLGFRTEALEKI
ncbi:FAS1-like dehydratase domain-containing protein [Paraburkholderia sp. HP33-1]|uniref:FAS1-like dehydratase domain-containing protein n=1 Tax=Paraburkholderia sp. HP33-1 TaxID=2883243 RepID=UPI001F1C1B0B|nr:MaoC family dehydratase N-terminal domain-containing protein [Paraburkholderia sp. HP33-1]